LVGQLDKLLATPTKESLDIAQQLAESFGYQLNEVVSVNPEAPGFMQTKLNVAPPTTPPFNPNQKYADALARIEAEKEAKAYMDAQASELRKQAAANAAAPAAGKEVAGAEKVVAQTKVADNLAAKGIKAVAPEAAKMALLKSGGKLISKVLPGVGLVVGTMDAIDRAKKGDYVGAGMAGLSAVLSLGGPLTAAASMGLDAANMARDYKATGDAFGGAPDMNKTATTPDSSGKPVAGGDPKLMQLQKLIGAKPDGLMGPETSGKLKAWQAQQGIKVDGLPGPETYGKAGIKEATQSVSESIRDMQARLELIESKHAIKESLGTEYFIDDEFMILDEHGEYVTDLLTIAVINESAEQGTVVVNEVNPLQYLGKGYEALKGLGGAVDTAARASKAPDAAEKLAATGKNLTGLQKGALKTGAAVGRNPVKAALGATALGAGAGLALGGGGGKPVTPDVVNPPPNVVKPHLNIPTWSRINSAAIAELLKQIHELMGHNWGDDQGWIAATSHAQAVVDKAEHASAAQTAMDQSHDTQAAPATQTASVPTEKFEESNDELTRWLRIARG
jgi:peptidoglycan hydrolase-like protein with peptidoglycan-binding domain